MAALSSGMSTPEELKAAAIFYAKEKGWSVMLLHGITEDGACTCPSGMTCSKAGKHPRFGGVFAHQATDDVEKLDALFDRFPNSNIGLPTGTVNGLLVIDADAKTPGALEQLDVLGLPPGPLVHTGGGGLHAYLAYPEDVEVASNSGQFRGVLDVRGRGGMVLVPPSNHASGRKYAWERKGGLPRTPDWLAEELKDNKLAKERFEVPNTIPEGGRDVALFRYASALRRNGLTEDEIYQSLAIMNNSRCDPPVSDEQLRSKARSAAKYDAGTLLTPGALGASTTPEFRIYTRDELDGIEPPDWLIKDYLPQGSFTVLYGKPGAYKSFLALDMAMHIATGKNWHDIGGKDGKGIHPVQQGPVAYLAGEGHYGMGMRTAAWEKMHRLRADELYVVGNPVQFAETDHLNAITDGLRDLRKAPSLVIIDTLSRSLAGRDENSAEDMSTFIQAVDAMKNALTCAVIIVHHENKDGSIRGSTALPGAADTMFQLARDENNQYTRLKCTKMKEAEEPEDLDFYPTPVMVQLKKGPPRTSIALADDTWTEDFKASGMRMDDQPLGSPLKEKPADKGVQVPHLHAVPAPPALTAPPPSEEPGDDGGLGVYLDRGED